VLDSINSIVAKPDTEPQEQRNQRLTVITRCSAIQSGGEAPLESELILPDQQDQNLRSESADVGSTYGSTAHYAKDYQRRSDTLKSSMGKVPGACVGGQAVCPWSHNKEIPAGGTNPQNVLAE